LFKTCGIPSQNCLCKMFSEGFSQTLAMGFGAQTSPQKTARAEEKYTCLPVTTKTVSDAVAQMQGDELRIHSQEVHMVLLAGIVEGLVKQAASLEFVLNDSTGSLRVRQYFTDSNASAEKFVAGQYVTVVGNIRVAPELHVSAQFVNCVESSDHVRYHIIESVHASLKLRNVNARDIATPQKLARPVHALTTAAPAAAASPTSMMKPSAADVAMPSAGTGDEVLRSAVLAMLQKVAENADGPGLKVSAIAQELAPAKEEVVKACLKALVDAGEAFNTIDDDHFNTFGTA